MRTPKICVHGDSPFLQTVQAELAAQGCQVCSPETLGDEPCDVFVSNVVPTEPTGRRQTDAAMLLIGDSSTSGQARLQIAEGSAARSLMQDDCTVREVVTAALLLAEITALRRQQQQFQGDRRRLTELALSDPLTGIGNRRAWDERAIELIKSSGSRPCCVAIVDVDGFKSINSSLGHPVGDACLREVAAQVTSAVRRHDLIARLGGDEFAVLLTGVDSSLAPKLVERIRSRISERPSAGAEGGRLQASAGWAVTTPSDDAVKSLAAAMAEADAALRQAKAAGKNRTLP